MEGITLEEEKKTVEPVPYFIHEGIMARMAECNKKLLIALIVAVVALVINNIVWVVYEGVVHGDDKEIVYEQETDTGSIETGN